MTIPSLLAEIEKLCPDTHLTMSMRWDDVIRASRGAPGDEIVAECEADLRDALDSLKVDDTRAAIRKHYEDVADAQARRLVGWYADPRWKEVR